MKESHSDVRAGLEEVEEERNGRLPFTLSRVEAKLLGIAGVRALQYFIVLSERRTVFRLASSSTVRGS